MQARPSIDQRSDSSRQRHRHMAGCIHSRRCVAQANHCLQVLPPSVPSAPLVGAVSFIADVPSVAAASKRLSLLYECYITTCRVALFDSFFCVVRLCSDAWCGRYWHRTLNPRKLIAVDFSRLAPRMNMKRTEKLYAVDKETKVSQWLLLLHL